VSEAATEPDPATVTVAVSPLAAAVTTAPDDEIVVADDELAAGDGTLCGTEDRPPPPPQPATTTAMSATSAPIRNLSKRPPAQCVKPRKKKHDVLDAKRKGTRRVRVRFALRALIHAVRKKVRIG